MSLRMRKRTCGLQHRATSPPQPVRKLRRPSLHQQPPTSSETQAPLDGALLIGVYALGMLSSVAATLLVLFYRRKSVRFTRVPS